MKIEELRSAYEKARTCNRESFKLDGKEFFTDYAKYLLEYLDGIGQTEVNFR